MPNDSNHGSEINPANGLPMMDDGEIDVHGNPYGTNWYNWQTNHDTATSYIPQPALIDPW